MLTSHRLGCDSHFVHSVSNKRAKPIQSNCVYVCVFVCGYTHHCPASALTNLIYDVWTQTLQSNV